jgi:hypothetical protein
VIGSSASWREGRKGRNRSLIWSEWKLNAKIKRNKGLGFTLLMKIKQRFSSF